MTERRGVSGVVVKGHGVASGQASDSPYPQGTIALQARHFEKRGLSLTGFHHATLNIDIAPLEWHLVKPDYCFELVEWLEGVPAETFSFVHAEIEVCGNVNSALIYHPHPDTKPAHFQAPSVIEVLAPFIPGVSYGDVVTLILDSQKLSLIPIRGHK